MSEIISMIPNREFKLSELSKINSSASEIDDNVAKKQIVLPKALISAGESLFIPSSLTGIVTSTGDEAKIAYESASTIFGSGSVVLTETLAASGLSITFPISPMTLLDDDFYNILLWADNYSNYGNIEVKFGADTNFYSYYGKTLKAQMNTKPKEWNNIALKFSDMTKTGTITSGTTINYIQILVYGAASKFLNVKFGGIKKGMKPRTAITFSFDDINQTDYTVAFQKLKSVGFNAITYVISEEVGTTVGTNPVLPRLTLAQMQEMRDYGWYFGIHGKDYFNWVTESTIAEAETRIRNCKQWLYDNGFIGKGLKHCAYPHGEYNDAIINLLKKYGIKYARTTNLWPQLSPIEDMHKIKLGIALTNDLNANISALESLITKGGLINIYAHDIYDHANSAISPDVFNSFVDYINENYRRYVTTIPDWCDDYETGTII